MSGVYRIGLVCVLAVFGLLAVGCGSRPTGPMDVPLVYRPTDPLNVGVAQGAMTKSASVVVEDQRDRKDKVGQNVEKEMMIDILTPSDPKAFVQEAVAQNLTAAGVRVGTSGDRVIHLALTRFWVREGTTYTGTVTATVRVTAGTGGQALWEGQVSGTNERFGRSLSPVNYQECFSDAVMQLTNHLLADEGFRAAMK